MHLLLFATALAAGLVDAIAGGGGLLTVPVLLGTGLPPHLALGTNKLQASFGSFMAARTYLRSGGVSWRQAGGGIACTLVGAVLGTRCVQQLSPDLLRRLIPLLLLGIFLYALFTPRLGFEDVHPRLSPALFYPVVGVGLGFYDGFFGPGTGSFWAIAFVVLLGFNLARATCYTKIMNFTSNVVSLAVFTAGGDVLLWTGLLMGAGQAAGARIGAHLVLRRGPGFVRPVFLAVVFATTLKLLYDAFVNG
ncbi:MAG: TSUP family transporter [Deltaproteobacteria bacterium]|nr:TSUP family transporter [Deltaproteobacteria bacterium]